MSARGSLRICLIWISLSSLCLITNQALAKYGGGSGTVDDPYLIFTAEQMNNIGLNSGDWSKYFKLMDDIDLSAYTGTSFNIIGVMGNYFNGSFDGNGHKILNFSYYKPGGFNIGIFGAFHGTVKNLGLISPHVDASTSTYGIYYDPSAGEYTGALIGYGGGNISSCYVEGGNVSGNASVGGLAGDFETGTISECYSTCSVSGFYNEGGLVGLNFGTITNCHFTGSASGKRHHVGGLVGQNLGIISACHSAGNITGPSSGDYYNTGGLVGVNGRDGKIISCYSTANAFNLSFVGGLVGVNWGEIYNSYARGNVYGNSWVGGLTGGNANVVYKCYSTGKVQGTSWVGGLIGDTDYGGVNINSFWDTQTSGRTYSDGGTGKTTNQMKSESTFTLAGWDFVGETANGTDDIWRMPCQTGYPILSWQLCSYYTGGSGTESDPWQISCPDDLLCLAEHPEDYNSCFILTADINLADYTFTTAVIAPIDMRYGYAISPFTGKFNGNGFVIRNLTIDSNGLFVDGLGLFGNTVYSEIKNLGIEDFYIFGGSSSSYVAGLAGYNRGTITNCYAKGTVISQENLFATGGLVGLNEEGIIEKCYSNISLKIGYFSGLLGGITGFNIFGTVINSYATSKIQSGDMSLGIGGLAGSNEYSTIRNCYASASITTGSQSDCIGGLVGTSLDGQVINSYAECNIKCNDHSTNIGGLAGSGGSISNCYVNGIVSIGDSSGNLGSFIGRPDGEIINCYTTCDVIGGKNCSNIGGFAGDNWGIINNCYSSSMISDVNESSNLGGFVGKNSQRSISNCFWDTQTSGITNGVGYIESGTVTNLLGKTTVEMKTQSTFTDYDWDFNTPVWVMWDGHEYPWLAWEREPVMVENISIIARERIGRTVFRYLCKVTLWNTRSQNFSNVIAELAEVPENVSVLDGVVGSSYIEAHTTAVSNDTFQIEVDRSVIIDPANMVWTITYETDGIQQQSLYVNNLDFLPSFMTGDITGDNIINSDDLVVLSNQWLQPPGNPSADIAPEPNGDGFVNFLDFAILAENWLK